LAELTKERAVERSADATILGALNVREVIIMKTLPVGEAEAAFTSLVAAAERGEPTTITREGKAAAVLVPVTDARKLYPRHRPDFVAFLLDYPGGIEFERDPSSLPDVDL
jgi:prevent-host-death family protein